MSIKRIPVYAPRIGIAVIINNGPIVWYGATLKAFTKRVWFGHCMRPQVGPCVLIVDNPL